MRGQYPTHRGFRPHPSGCPERIEAGPARFFLCARCRASVLICSHCDRGQFTAPEAAQRTRAARPSARPAARPASRRGRIAHALRARGYRHRQKNVTHQGSLPQPPDDLLPEDLAAASERPSPGGFARPPAQRCLFGVMTMKSPEPRHHGGQAQRRGRVLPVVPVDRPDEPRHRWNQGGWLSQGLNGESQLSEHPHCAAFPPSKSPGARRWPVANS